jgi:DNA polymerase-3 subunit beta
VKIRIDRDKFADAVAWAARSLPARPTMPILAGMLIKAVDGIVTFSSFDYETSAEVEVAAQIFEDGKTLVSGKLLDAISRQLQNRPVTITTQENRTEIECGSSRFTLQSLPVAEYPVLPQMPPATGTVASNLFDIAVKQVITAAGKDELLPIYTGVRIEIDGDTLSLLSTDRYRMALKEIKWNPSAETEIAAAIIPAKVLGETVHSMGSGNEIVISLSSNSLGDGLMGFEGEGQGGKRQLTTRLLDGEFPKFRHLMDVKGNVVVRVKKEDLIAAVKRISLVAERNTALRMTINDNQIVLEAATGDQAQGSEAIEAVVERNNDDAEKITAVGFNPSYLADAVGALDTVYVHFAFTAPGQPCLLQGLNDVDGIPETDYKHVIMLMRLPV